jgi:hypothetical protein
VEKDDVVSRANGTQGAGDQEKWDRRVIEEVGVLFDEEGFDRNDAGRAEVGLVEQ